MYVIPMSPADIMALEYTEDDSDYYGGDYGDDDGCEYDANGDLL